MKLFSLVTNVSVASVVLSVHITCHVKYFKLLLISQDLGYVYYRKLMLKQIK